MRTTTESPSHDEDVRMARTCLASSIRPPATESPSRVLLRRSSGTCCGRSGWRKAYWDENGESEEAELERLRALWRRRRAIDKQQGVARDTDDADDPEADTNELVAVERGPGCERDTSVRASEAKRERGGKAREASADDPAREARRRAPRARFGPAFRETRERSAATVLDVVRAGTTRSPRHRLRFMT